MPTDRPASTGRFALLALLPLVLSACRTEPAATVATDSTSAMPGPAADSASAPADTAVGPVLALDTDGLRFVDGASGSTRPVAFGTPRAATMTALTTVAGAPRETGTNTECGAGPLDFAMWGNGLTAWFQNDAFAGWAVAETADTALTTMAGVGVGSPRTAVESAYAATTEQTTLGTEFSAGSLSGVYTSDAPDARVETLWAGVNCVFR